MRAEPGSHDKSRPGRQQAQPGSAAEDSGEHRAVVLPAAIQSRDPLALQWWVIERIIDGALQPPQAAAISGVVRTLANLPPGARDEAAALASIALRGQLMHGIPPRTPEQWALAATMFDDEALAEFRRWELLEDDRGDVREPLGLGDGLADDGDVAPVVHDEDG